MESVLKEAGSCGRYHVIHVIFTQLPRIVAIWVLFFMMFGGYNPGWRCVITNSTNVTNASTASLTPDISISDATNNAPTLMNFSAINPDSLRNAIDNKSMQAYEELTWECEVKDSCTVLTFDTSSHTIVTEFNLICDRSWVVRAILFIQGVGFFLGPLVGGQFGDKFGRNVTLYGCTFIICLLNIIAIFSTNWQMFVSCYFFIGAASNSIIAISPVYAMEFLNAKWRGYFASIPITNLALVLFVTLTLVLKHWVSLHLVAICLSFVACIGFFIIPESPRWLVANGHSDRASKSVLRIARVNKKISKNKQNVLIKMHKLLESESDRKKTYTFLDLVRNRRTRICTMKFGLMYFATTCTYQTITFGIKSLPGDYYMNAIQAICTETVVVLTIGPLCNRIGRRFGGLFFSCFGMACSLIIVLMLSFSGTGERRDMVLKIAYYLAKSSSQCLVTIMTLFSTEQLPTIVRTVAVGILRCCSGLGALAVPFILPDRDDTSLITAFSVMCACYCMNAVLFPFFSETNRGDLSDKFTGGNDLSDKFTGGNDLSGKVIGCGDLSENCTDRKRTQDDSRSKSSDAGEINDTVT